MLADRAGIIDFIRSLKPYSLIGDLSKMIRDQVQPKRISKAIARPASLYHES